MTPEEPGSALIFTEALTHGTLPWAAAMSAGPLFYRYSPAMPPSWAHIGRTGGSAPAGPTPRPTRPPTTGTRWPAGSLEPPYVHERLDTLTGDPPCDSVRFDAAAGPAEAEKDG